MVSGLKNLKPNHWSIVQASFEDISADIRQWGDPTTTCLAPSERWRIILLAPSRGSLQPTNMCRQL